MLRPVTTADRAGIRDLLTKSLRRGLDPDTFTLRPGDGWPELIAGTEPVGPINGWNRRAGRAICDRWARGDRATILPHRDAYYQELCGPYLGGGLPGPPESGPPFTGGQCAISYSVGTLGSETCPAFVGDWSGFTSGPGPISGITSVTVDTGMFPVPMLTTWTVSFSDGDRNFSIRHNAGIVPCYRVYPSDPATPDDCGNVDDQFDPGGPNPTPDPNPGPIPPPDGYPGPGVEITVNVDGTINVDFGDGNPPDVIDPTDPNPGGGGGGGGGGLPGPPPGDIGEPGAPVETGPGGQSSGEAPPGQVLGALKVNFLALPPKPREFAEGVYRAVCYAYLGTIEGLDLDPAGAVMRDGQLILAERDNLTRFQVNANVGFDLRITPYYRTVEVPG